MPGFYVRVVKKHELHKFTYKKGVRAGKQGSMFSAELVGKDGRESRATFFGEAVV